MARGGGGSRGGRGPGGGSRGSAAQAVEDIAVYGIESCPHSVRAAEQAAALVGRPVPILPRGAEPPGLRKPGHTTIPNVVVSGEPVGGADDLRGLVDAGLLVAKISDGKRKEMDGANGFPLVPMLPDYNACEARRGMIVRA